MITWKFYKFPANAEKCYHEISNIGETATPQAILEFARNNEESELHKCFTWDDTEAAEKWRVHEARQLVLNLVVIKEEEGKPSVPIRLIQRTTSDGYAPLKFFKKNEDEYHNLLERAKSELLSFKNRYSQIAELEEILEAISKFL